MANEEQPTSGVSRARWLSQTVFKAIAVHMFMSMLLGATRNKVDPATGKPPQPYHNFLGANELYDIYVYVTEDEQVDIHKLEDNAQLVFSAENQVYSHKFNSPFEITATDVNVTETFLKDESKPMYAVVYLVPHKAYESKAAPFFKSQFKSGFNGHVIVESVPLTTMRQIKKSKETNLFAKEEELPDVTEEEETCKHWIPRLDVNVVYDVAPHVYSPNDVYFLAFRKYPEEKVYDPLVYLSQFWVLDEHYQPTKSVQDQSSLKLNVHFGTCGPTYYLVSTQFKANSEKGGFMGRQSAKELEMVKKTLMTTNIYMLIFSAAFITLHSVFSFFAMKNDIQFWHKNESMEGLSALSVVISFVCEIIIALYIFDSENVSWLILFEISIGLVASAWKVSKAVKITFKRQFPYVEMGNARNYVESDTKKYDEAAIKYMSIALLPCVLAYAVYSLLYEKHKSWYSYLISVAAGSVYTFGFIMMTPQIYINYKLKSVDHLPWRALIYKSLNTFVDDVASFLIDMPWMHRLSCFRDDIIFFCYLYQRWAYRVDPSRPNSWNQGSAEEQSASREIEEKPTDVKAKEKQERVTNLDEATVTNDREPEQPVRRR